MTTVNYDRAVSYYDETRGFRPGVSERYRHAVLELTGADTRAIDLLTYRELPVSCRTMVDRRAQRMFRSDWALPEPIHRTAARMLYDWLERDCPNADEPAERRMLFRAIIARF